MKSKSAFLCKLILHGYIYNVDYSYLRNYNTELGRINSNLNQIVKRINSTDHIYQEDMDEVRKSMNQVWHPQQKSIPCFKGSTGACIRSLDKMSLCSLKGYLYSLAVSRYFIHSYPFLAICPAVSSASMEIIWYFVIMGFSPKNSGGNAPSALLIKSVFLNTLFQNGSNRSSSSTPLITPTTINFTNVSFSTRTAYGTPQDG